MFLFSRFNEDEVYLFRWKPEQFQHHSVVILTKRLFHIEQRGKLYSSAVEMWQLQVGCLPK